MKKWRDAWRDEGPFKIHKKSGYRVNRSLVKTVTIILLLYLSFAFFWALTHERYYLACEAPGGCENPLYGQECARIGAPGELCAQEWLYEGFRAGYDVPSPLRDAHTYSLLALAAAFLINHAAYNTKEDSNNRG